MDKLPGLRLDLVLHHICPERNPLLLPIFPCNGNDLPALENAGKYKFQFDHALVPGHHRNLTVLVHPVIVIVVPVIHMNLDLLHRVRDIHIGIVLRILLEHQGIVVHQAHILDTVNENHLGEFCHAVLLEHLEECLCVKIADLVGISQDIDGFSLNLLPILLAGHLGQRIVPALFRPQVQSGETAPVKELRREHKKDISRNQSPPGPEPL